MDHKAFQDYYPHELSHCYGCGRLNEHGLQIKSYWDGKYIFILVFPFLKARRMIGSKQPERNNPKV